MIKGFSDRPRGRRRWRIGWLVCCLAVVTAAFVAVPAVLAAKPHRPIARAAVDNPALARACGLRVLLVLDSSGSVGQFNAEADVKEAATGFVNALFGTGSQLSIAEFAQNAFALGQTRTPASNNPGVDRLMERATPVYHVVDNTSRSTFEDFIDSYDATAGGNTVGGIGTHNATNWEAALNTALRTPNTRPDLVVFVTDGNPTTSGFPGGSNVSNTLPTWTANLPPAETVANNVKTAHTRIFALGVGHALDTEIGSDARLQAVSGPNELSDTHPFYDREDPANSADWVVQPDFGQLGTELRTFVQELCAPSVIVTKLTQAVDGTPQPASGWDFTAHLMTDPEGHRWTNPDAGTGPEATATSGDDGIARFEWALNAAHATSTVNIAREQKQGEPFRFGEAQCTKVTTTSEEPVEIKPFPDFEGIPKIELGPEDFARCDVLNLEHAATIEVRKNIFPHDDPGKFDLSIAGKPVLENVEAPGGQSDPVTLPLGTHSVSETGANGTDLTHYDTTVECVDANNADRVVVPKEALHGTTERSVQVPLENVDEAIVCIFTNTSNRDGQITVIKHLVPDTDSGRFNLLAGGHTVAHNAGDGDHGSIRLPFGMHEVTEHPANGTNLGHYNISTQCFDENTGDEVAHNAHGPAVSVHLTRAVDNIQCTITNERHGVKVGRLEVIKHLSPHGSGLFNLLIGGTPFALSVGHNGTTGPLDFELGTHTVTEHGVDGTKLADFSIHATCLDKAHGNHQVAHNAHGPSVSVDLSSESDNIVCTITNTLKQSPGEGGGGEEPTPPGPGPHLAVVKTMPPHAQVGETVPISIVVHNLGHGTAHGVQLAEKRPPGLQIVSVANHGTIQHGNAIWHLGNLAPGASVTVHATARVVHTGLHVDTAVATALNADPALSDASVRARAAAHPPRPPHHPPPPFTG